MPNSVDVIKNLDIFLAKKTEAEIQAEFMSAIARGNIKAVKNLVAREHITLDFSTSNGISPLGMAINVGSLNIADFLIKSGCDVNYLVWQGETVLTMIINHRTEFKWHYSSCNDYINLLSYFITQGANIELMNTEGNTPLLCSALKHNIDITKFLLDQGDNPNAKNSSSGDTALHQAIDVLDTKMVELLLEKGADWHLQNNEGITPLDKCNTLYSILIEKHSGDAMKAENIINLFQASDPISEEPQTTVYENDNIDHSISDTLYTDSSNTSSSAIDF